MVLSNKVLSTKNPLSGNYPFYVLVETSGSNDDHDQEKLGVRCPSAVASRERGAHG